MFVSYKRTYGTSARLSRIGSLKQGARTFRNVMLSARAACLVLSVCLSGCLCVCLLACLSVCLPEGRQAASQAHRRVGRQAGTWAGGHVQAGQVEDL